MKYFLDTEFIESFHKPIFGKRRHFIDLISIGIVRQDGKSYYAISNEFNEKDADQWVRDNVISKLPPKNVNWNPQGGDGPRVCQESLLYKSNKQIRLDILQFFGCYEDSLFWRAPPGIEVYGYYADYDWVLFCSLFGRMIDLPRGFPMYCRDIKQMMAEKAKELFPQYDGYPETQVMHFKKQDGYPSQKDEHHALTDAAWNKKLYDYLTIS